MIPSVGRVVHYYGKLEHIAPFGVEPEPDNGPFAALVIDVTGRDVCTLEVTGRAGHKYVRANVAHAEDTALGSWSWPPRVT